MPVADKTMRSRRGAEETPPVVPLNPAGAEAGLGPGPLERELLEAGGNEVYEIAVNDGWIDEDDSRFAAGTENRAIVELLTELGLLRHEPGARRFHPIDPTAASDQLVVPMSQRGSELLAESARWSETFARLGQAYRNSPLSLQRSITELHGVESINAYIDARLTECSVELLTAQPYGKRRASTLAQVESRDVQALRRGVSMRTLYQHSARQSPATREYVAEVSALGAEVRTLDEFFKRLLIFDRHTAIIPATENHAVAVAIHDKSVVAYLVDIFDRAWERGLPYTVSDAVAQRAVAADVRAMTLRLLVEGHSDAVSAKRLGVSARTYAAYIAALKEEYGVQTRFQLGWAMSQTETGDRTPRAGRPEDVGF